MRYLSLYLPFLATDRIRRRFAPLEASARKAREKTEAPLATIARVKSAFRLVALDPTARALGLRPGLPLADARAMHPRLDAHDADPDGDRAALDALVDWCRLFTPLAAPDGQEADGQTGVVLDITGAAHLFGGEPALMETLVGRLAAQGFHAVVAVAGTPGAAWALARHGGGDRRIAEGTSPAACARRLAPMPLAALRLEPETIAQLGQAGLRCVGDLLVRPRAPIAARFGRRVHARLDELLGLARGPIVPRFETPPFVAERRFAEGIARREDVEATILSLAHDLCGLLARHGEGARRLDVALYRVDGVVKHIAAGSSRPLRDPAAMARLFRERIEAAGEEGLDTGYGFDVVRLAALAAERLDPSQTAWRHGCGDAGTSRDDALADLVDRLGARFGPARVVRLADADSHVPERAAVTRDAGGAYGSSPDTAIPRAPGALPDRPIRLFDRPEPIEALAEVPDGPPLRFRWRRVMHQVAAIEGPERIAPEWWRRDGTRTRDYFRAQDTDGRRFWLYREGLYSEAETPCWYMHGLFA